MKRDRFWDIFFISVLVLVILDAGLVTLNVLSHSRESAPAPAFDPTVDPYTLPEEHVTATTTGYLYHESLPFDYSSWTWNATVNWLSTERVFDGSRSAKISYTAPWGGVHIDAGSIQPGTYRSLTLAVFGSEGIADLTLSLEDPRGRTQGEQSLGWYFPEKKFISGAWYEIAIPLTNLGYRGGEIGGITISSATPGTLYLDEVRLSPEVVTHTRSPIVSGEAPDPFLNAPNVPLPYVAPLALWDAASWYALSGSLHVASSTLRIDPPQSTTYAFALFRGGKEWTNYRFDVIADWRTSDVLGLAARFVDDGNYVECSFANRGTSVSIYQVTKGVSKKLAHSPQLLYGAPQNVRHGIVVLGSEVSCYLNGTFILRALVPDMPRAGSVGVEIWSRFPGALSPTVTALTVEGISP